LTSARSGGRRRRGRELALRVLFELEGTDKVADDALEYSAEELGAAPDVRVFAAELVHGCVDQSAEIDQVITAASSNWRLEDIGKVERAVLRLGACELRVADTPVPVVIDESVELAKAYAGQEAAQFVNGVLGRIARDAQ
jgi:N utilization substance protein B